MIRPLTKELQKIAIEELHEDPQMVEEDIKNIQEWIKQQPHLNAPNDKQWILGFLRGCKFSYETTKSKIDMFYSANSSMPDIARPRDIFSTEMQTLLKSGLVLPIPYCKNYTGPRILLFDFKNSILDTNIINPVNASALFFMMLKILMVEDDNLIVSGQTVWADMTHYPLRYLLYLTPTFLKNFVVFMESALPIRVKGFHITGYPAFAEKMLNVLKGFMSPKLRQRVFIHSESNFENIFKHIPKSIVPKEFRGDNISTKDIAADWKNKVESYSTWFIESNQYCTNESLRPEKPVSLENVIGINGSFRKLNLD